jgi:hypothetical protein
VGGPRYPARFHIAAAQGSFVYAYIRAETSETGAAGTPYYIGIASNPRRPFRDKNRPVPAPLDRSLVRIIRRRLTWEEAGEWEKRFIAHYGLAHEGGLLRNRNTGGCGTRGATPEVRAAASERLKTLLQDPVMQEKIEKARRDPRTTAKKSAAAKAYFAQPGAKEAHSTRQKECSNRPDVRAKMAAAKDAAFLEKLKERGMTKEEWDLTPAGKSAAAVKRYRARLRLKREQEAEPRVA